MSQEEKLREIVERSMAKLADDVTETTLRIIIAGLRDDWKDTCGADIADELEVAAKRKGMLL